MDFIRLTAHLLILLGAVNTGVLTSGDKALLFDCGDTVTAERLANFGITEVEQILCTQHRRANVSGAYAFVNKGARLAVPAGERELFEKTDEYWHDWKNRWHVYKFQPGPQVLISPLPVSRSVKEGDIIEWENYKIHVLDTPGATTGAVSYLVDVDGKTFCFSGDAIYGAGQVWDLFSLQSRHEYGLGDYHSFLDNLHNLKPSLRKLGSCGADALIPSHGEVIYNPSEAVSLTIERLEEAWRNYTSISGLRYYFPKMMAEGDDDPSRMPRAPEQPEIPFARRIPSTTSFLLTSKSGAALLIDCGLNRVVVADVVRKMIESGEITSIEGVWVTHYHDDHVDALGTFYNSFQCPIITDETTAEILEHPRRFLLPCISPNSVTVTRKTKHGERWQWHEFTLTAFHFPGQTYYHSGLLAEGRGKRIFFAGDALSTTGINDHCSANRNFLGKGRGFNKCLDILLETKPDVITGQHHTHGWRFSDEQINYMKSVLAEREKIFAELLPWEHPNFGTDIWWVRAYPYELDVFGGGTFTVEMQFTNHAHTLALAKAESVLPEGWSWKRTGASSSTIYPQKDGGVRLAITVPRNAERGQYVIPFRITWNKRYLGQIRHAVVNVM